MASKHPSACRKCSLITAFMLLLQTGFTQPDFSKAGIWLTDNVKDLGGRVVLVIFKDGKLLYNNAVNDLSRRQKLIGKFMAKRQGKDPEEALTDFSSKTKERIASCSKWLSAALVMTFVDEGKLNLNDSIGSYLPVMTANGKGYIKISHCLSHLTGIKSGSLKDSREIITNAKTMDAAIEGIAKQPMEGEPGKTFHYSSAGLQVAAAIIEKISGKDFETLFQERIAIPCEMMNSDFGNGKIPLAAGSAWSTAEDYINFLEMILNEGMFRGRKVLSRQSVLEMQKNRVSRDAVIAYTPAEAGNWGYGYGEWVMNSPLQTSPEEGPIPGSERLNTVTSPGLFGSFPWVNNDLKYAGFLFTFNLNSKGRQERYVELKKIIDKAIISQ